MRDLHGGFRSRLDHRATTRLQQSESALCHNPQRRDGDLQHECLLFWLFTVRPSWPNRAQHFGWPRSHTTLLVGVRGTCRIESPRDRCMRLFVFHKLVVFLVGKCQPISLSISSQAGARPANRRCAELGVRNACSRCRYRYRPRCRGIRIRSLSCSDNLCSESAPVSSLPSYTLNETVFTGLHSCSLIPTASIYVNHKSWQRVNWRLCKSQLTGLVARTSDTS